MEDETRILLVDDERLVRRSMEKTLTRAGFDVETAGDTQTGLALFEAALAAETPFQLAIVDLHMPNLQGEDDSNAGLQLLSKFLEIQADLPVVVLTAFDEVGRAKEAVARGAAAYFVKGREAGLLELVENILDEWGDEDEE